MSCVMPTLLPRLAAISGLPAERLGQMVDAARRKQLPPLPLDPAVVDVMAAGLPASHDPQQVAAVLQAVAQGLRLALRQLRDRPPDPQVLALLAALTGTALPDAPAPDPSRVQSVRTKLYLRPAPLPLVLPSSSDARRQAVLAAALMAPWTDDEVERIASDSDLAGLAWALDVRHPRIRAVIDESLEAVVAAIREGVTDSDLLQRVATNDLSDYQVMRVLIARPDITAPALIARAAQDSWAAAHVLAASSRTDPALIRAAARRPATAAQVLVKRPDITDSTLITKAAEDADDAAQVLAARPDLTDPALIRAAAEDAEAAAQVLAKRPDITDPALIARAAETSETAADVLVARQDIADPALITKAAKEPWSAAHVLAARQDIADPALIRAAAREPEPASEVLAARRDITTPALLRAAARKPDPAAHVLASRRDITTPALLRAAAREPEPAAHVLASRRDITTPALIARAAETSAAAAHVLVKRQDITDPALIAKAAEDPRAAAKVLAARQDITDPALITKAAERPDTAAAVLVKRQDLTDPALLAAAAEYAETAVQVLVARQDITDPALIAKVAVWPSTAAEVLAARQDLRSRRDVLDCVRSHRVVAHAVVDALGPYPALWDVLPAPLRDEIAVRYRMTPSERAWLAGLAIRTPPAWTEADDQMAARFPWHATLRASLRATGPALVDAVAREPHHG